MSHDPSPPAAPAPAAKSGSLIRLGILVLLLLVAIGMWYYDYSFAGPRSTQAHDEIQTFVDKKNEEGVSNNKGERVVRREDIKNLLGFAPTYTKKEKDYDVEYYCWWGPIPGLNTWKRYITVVYVGPEPRRYQTHHLNEPPPDEMLPGYIPPIPEGAVPGVAGMGGGAPPMGPPAMGPPGMGPPGMKGKGGRGRGAAPGEGDAPTTDTPGEGQPATEGEKPATEGEKPATEDEKPADPPKEGDTPKPATEGEKPAESPADADKEKPAAPASEAKPASEEPNP
jgi:hypothetical protein